MRTKSQKSKAAFAIQCGFTVLSVAMALGLRTALSPWLGAEAPYLFFGPAVLVAAWFGGAIQGVIALVLGWLSGDYFFTPPLRALGPYSGAELALIADYLVVSVTGVALIHIVRRAYARIRDYAGRLEVENEERRRAEEQLRAAKAQIEHHAEELEIRVAERTASLKRSAESMEELLYAMVHNLRAPNRAMQGFAGILQSDHAGQLDAEGLAYLQRIVEAARRNDSMIQDLLELGHYSHCELKVGRHDLGAIVARALEPLQPELERKQGTVQLPEHWPHAMCDPDALQRAVFHLLMNAVKFTRPDAPPLIRISANETRDMVSLAFQDNGIGIAEEYLARILRPMERLHHDGTYPGNGIGLALVKQIMDRLGGRILVQSRLGYGSTFTLELLRPAAPAPSRKPHPSAVTSQL